MNADDPSGSTATGASRADAALTRWVAAPRLDVLKVVAIVSMFVDHLNAIWFEFEYPALTAIGRLAFPLFAFVLAYNFVRHTRRRTWFVGRLLLWGAASQVIYAYAFQTEMWNIFFTLAAGLGYAALFPACSVVRSIAGIVLGVVLLAAPLWNEPVAAKLDFGIEGVLAVFACAQVIDRPTWWRGAFAVAVIAALNVGEESVLSITYGAAALLSLVLIAVTAQWPGEWRWVRKVRLGFYFFYPAHLFVLKALAE